MASVNFEVKAQVDDAIRALGRMSKSTDALGKVNQDAAGALGVFGVSLTALNNPLTLVADGLKASIDKSIEWGNTIDDVQKITGESAEKTSKLVAVMNDFGVEAGTLKAAARSLKEQGLSPNLETLKDLAQQYQNIQDPAKRVEWGTKTLGRSFFDLSEILTKTPEEFAAVERAALSSGKVIGQDFVDAMEASQIKAKQLQDRMDGLSLVVGNFAVNTLSDAVTGGENWVKMWGAVNLAIQKNTGIITEEQAALRATALVAGDLSAVYTEQFDPAITSTTDAVDRQNERLAALSTTVATAAVPNVDALTASAERWKAMAAQAEAEAALKLRLEDLTGAASDLAFGMGDLTTATLFHQAAQGLDADAAYALAQQMGLIDPAADAAKQILDDLRVELEKGALTTGQYNSQVGLLDMAIRSLPDGKTITVTYLEEYRAALNDEANRGNDQVGGAIGDGYSHGTGGNWLTVPAGYPNDSYPIRLQSGEEFAVKRPGEGAPGGGLYIGSVNITAAPGQDAESLWKQIRVIAARDARAMSQAGV